MTTRTHEPATAGRTVEHSTFVIDRTFDATPARVFHAFADPVARARWFVGPDRWQSSDHSLDFRVGGREHVSGGPPGGPRFVYDALYQDVIPNSRIVYSYEMYMGEQRISVSLSTIELLPDGDRTRLVMTEQDAFLDGADHPADRERGTREQFDNLATELRRA